MRCDVLSSHTKANWSPRSSEVDAFHLIWKGLCDLDESHPPARSVPATHEVDLPHHRAPAGHGPSPGDGHLDEEEPARDRGLVGTPTRRPLSTQHQRRLQLTWLAVSLRRPVLSLVLHADRCSNASCAVQRVVVTRARARICSVYDSSALSYQILHSLRYRPSAFEATHAAK